MSGGLLLYVRVASKGGSTVPVDVDPMATVEELIQALGQVLEVKEPRGRLLHGGAEVSDRRALLADVGVAAEGVLDWEDLRDPTDDNVVVVKVGNLAPPFADLNGEYRRVPVADADEHDDRGSIPRPEAGSDQHNFGFIDLFVQDSAAEEKGLIFRTGREGHQGRWKLTRKDEYMFSGWFPSGGSLLGLWVHDSADGTSEQDPYPNVSPERW
eukprot:TRINITY_DN21449_c0_g1_i1.p1 TRINITY_DN21449_c0_g1~~TRINITY_DN21449_c0_g1_i1.p1  ORF type:complete len:230 (+),score=46.18 TRINITY_DN21449_c0_g1_i1:55-690(+)